MATARGLLVATAVLPCFLAGFAAARLSATEPQESLFERSVAPILEMRCVGCHSGAEPKGGLSLETREGLISGGDSGPAVVPGDAKQSLLVDYVSGDSPEMPKNGEPLSKAELAALREWISSGAAWDTGRPLVDRRFEDRSWWSIRPLAHPTPPACDSEWVRTPIDAFIMAALEARGLNPSEEADRRTLIRRLSFDLCGLPPTPDELEAFAGDPDPMAYERLVDRLLASPRYGERWGRHWLDVVHYADTHGYDKDKVRPNAWPYRDYVIASFNADNPYSQFVLEQVAGDALDAENPQALVATGFVAAGPWDFVGHMELREGTVDKLITRLLDRDDMAATTMTTFVSLTAHCARCHDHPFDPIRQEEYYRLQAVFAGVDRGDREFADLELARRRSRLQASKDELSKELDGLRSSIEARAGLDLQKIDGELSRTRRDLKETGDPFEASDAPADSPTNGYHSQIEGQPEGEKWVQVDLGLAIPLQRVRLIPARPTDFRDSPGFGFPVRFKVETAIEAKGGPFETLADFTGADFSNPGRSAVEIEAVGRTARIVRVTAVRLWERTNDFAFALGELQVESQGKNAALGREVSAFDSIEAGRWSTRALVDGFDSRHRAADPGDRKTAEAAERTRELRRVMARLSGERGQLIERATTNADRRRRIQLEERLAAVEGHLKELPPAGLVYAVRPVERREVQVLARGDVRQPLSVAGPGTVEMVGLPARFAAPEGASEGEGRAALAVWLSDRQNPLVWRSIVNRVWHYHFDRGIVDTPNDFGRMGSRPTLPELLDWLAWEFREQGESLKWLHRLIVTSSVYRQVSRHDESSWRIDSGNRTLWRMNRRRLDAESLRDAVLAVSGRLDPSMGGPGFATFAFEDDHSPRYRYEAHDPNDPASLKRTVYRFVVRSVPDPFIECMDGADASQSVPVRTETITPLQALGLLNNRFMLAQAEALAARVTNEAPDLASRVERAFLLALGRKPTLGEAELLGDYAHDHGLAAACRLILNSNEFVFID
jgi:hypothetical protein